MKKLIQSLISSAGYTRIVKALIRSSIIHEKSEKFRRDVINAISAAQFEADELQGVKKFPTYDELVSSTIERASNDDHIWVELGVMTGRSARKLVAEAARQGRSAELHGFDSFEGLPEDWHARAKKGAFAIRQPTFSETNIHIHVGLFDETLPVFAKGLKAQIGLIHIDSDLYSSAKTAFDELKPFIGKGTVILFDEYWNYPEFMEHEIKAFREFLAQTGLGFEYIGYYPDHMQLSVVIT
ncbi:MAG: class I SAM-dependent methyltransferase [Hyphomicrobiales bacterium]